MTLRRLAPLAFAAAVLLASGAWWTARRTTPPPRANVAVPRGPDVPAPQDAALAAPPAPASAPRAAPAGGKVAAGEARALRARVVDPRGGSLAGETVAWSVRSLGVSRDLDLSGSTVLGELGALEIALGRAAVPGGEATLELRLDAARAGRFELSRWPPPGVTELGALVLAELPLLAAGSVVDARGRPVSGARVLVETSGPRVEVATDARGRFEAFGPAQPGDVRVRAEKHDLRSGARAQVATGRADVRLELHRDGWIAGRVLHGCDGTPANLRVAAAPRSPGGEPRGPVELERDGAFLLRNVHPGRYDVAVLAGGEEPLAVAVDVEVWDGARGDVPTFDLRGVLREVVVHVTADDVRAPAVQLAYRPSGSGAEWSTVTAIGTTRIVTPASALDLVATAPGYVPAEAAAAAGTVELRLARGIPVTLRLREQIVLGWWEVGTHATEHHGNVDTLTGHARVRSGVELRVPRPGLHTVTVTFSWIDVEEQRRPPDRVRDAQDGSATWSEILAELDRGRIHGEKRVEREVELDVLDTHAGQTFWIDLPPEVPRRVAAPAER